MSITIIKTMLEKKPTARVFFYHRVSSLPQDLERAVESIFAEFQLTALVPDDHNFGKYKSQTLENRTCWYGGEKISATKTKINERPMLNMIIKAMQAGDILVVEQLDRLGRNSQELIQFLKNATAAPEDNGWGINIIPIRQAPLILTPIDKNDTSPQSLLMQMQTQVLTIALATYTEIESNTRRERSYDKIQQMKGKGLLGRKPRPIKPLKKIYDQEIKPWLYQSRPHDEKPTLNMVAKKFGQTIKNGKQKQTINMAWLLNDTGSNGKQMKNYQRIDPDMLQFVTYNPKNLQK
ncbi:MAG: recombinase family protein [Alphaproteobacteria bacterium]